jgi:hypothetical protein
MRHPTYLSPSQLALFEKNPEEWYLQHGSETRIPKLPQTRPMSIGSSADAYIKSAMHETLFGKGADPRFEFDTIFTEQVEEHNRDWAKENGKYVFECYKKCGTYDELLKLLQQSKDSPQFEFKITGTVNDVPLLGKPDLRFVHSSGALVIFDWKVSGYCSKSPTSPCKNYRIVRDCWDSTIAKPTRGVGQAHKNYKPIVWKGVEIHSGWLEEANEDWADQLAIYAWMLGEPVGSQEMVVCIDQIVAKPAELKYPLLRVANYRARISTIHQENLLQRITNCWQAIMSGNIFSDLTPEENRLRCQVLDRQAIMASSIDETQQYLNKLGRSWGYAR